jgi:chemotaxis protein MotB
MAAKTQPIIVIRKKSGHGGHHGGAWKVAYADFVTAMMSLFIVLWLMGSSEKVKKAVAGYFNDPKGLASQLGTTMTGTGQTVAQVSTDELEKLKEKLEQEIKARKELEKLSKQIEITITPEGLRIELIEGKDGTFYQSGSARLSDSGQELLALLAAELKTLPNSLLIEGHTDATPYSSDASYSNWDLSADRANSARRLLQQDGVRADQVTQVRGYADQMLRVKTNPTDPSNRRVSILEGANPRSECSQAAKLATGCRIRAQTVRSTSCSNPVQPRRENSDQACARNPSHQAQPDRQAKSHAARNEEVAGRQSSQLPRSLFTVHCPLFTVLRSPQCCTLVSVSETFARGILP